MSKNIEICINIGNSYETLYPKINLNNVVNTLAMSNITGNLDISRIDNLPNKFIWEKGSWAGTGTQTSQFSIQTVNKIKFVIVLNTSNPSGYYKVDAPWVFVNVGADTYNKWVCYTGMRSNCVFNYSISCSINSTETKLSGSLYIDYIYPEGTLTETEKTSLVTLLVNKNRFDYYWFALTEKD